MSRSSDSPSARVQLVVSADPGTEIFVINHAFRLCAQGVGGLAEELEPGLYKLRYRAGSAIQEVYQAIEPGAATVRISAPRITYSSAAPLAGTRTSHGYQQEAASRFSREVHATFGQGSEVFVFARTWSDPNRPSEATDVDPAAALSLHDRNGALLVELSNIAKRSGGGTERCTGCTVALSPGPYRLRVTTSAWGPLEQVVIASPGWQTQVFLAHFPGEVAAGGDGPRGGLDLARTSVLQARIGHGFDAQRDDLRLADLARIGLANHRVIVQASELLEKAGNPMLVIYGAHALLRVDADFKTNLGAVVDKLRSLVGLHPDVEALALEASRPSPGYVFDCPPMLAGSWSLVLKEAGRRPDLVPHGSLAERVSPHLWGSGPWLLWLGDEVAQAASQPQAVDLSNVVAQVAAAAALLRADQRVALGAAELTDIEEALLVRVTRPVGTTPAQPGAPQPYVHQASPVLSVDLSEALGVPPAAIQSVAASLLHKLKRAADTGKYGPPPPPPVPGGTTPT